MTITSQFTDITSSSNFWRCFVPLVKFSYWSKFHGNIITGSRAMTIYFYKELNQKSGNRKTLVWILRNIIRLGWVSNIKFGTDVSNEMLLNVAKSQGYSLHCFWVIKGKPTGGVKLPTSHPTTQIRVKHGPIEDLWEKSYEIRSIKRVP